MRQYVVDNMTTQACQQVSMVSTVLAGIISSLASEGLQIQLDHLNNIIWNCNHWLSIQKWQYCFLHNLLFTWNENFWDFETKPENEMD